MRVLLIEDHACLRQLIMQGLDEDGFIVDSVATATAATACLRIHQYEMALLDIGLPDRDGFDFLLGLRNSGCQIPVLIISARDALDDRIRGLDIGADDYLVKPFALDELLARVRAIIRRSFGMKSSVILFGDLRVDTFRKTVTLGTEDLDLTAREYAILELLAFRKDRLVSRGDILESLYHSSESPSSNIVDVFIRRIRAKLEINGAPRLIHTKRGAGYIMKSVR